MNTKNSKPINSPTKPGRAGVHGRPAGRAAAAAGHGPENGDAKLIKNAGALVTHQWGSVMRSLVVAVYELRAEEICVVATTTAACAIDPARILASAQERGVSADTIATLRGAGIDLDSWLKGFDNVHDSVRHTVATIRSHPLMPRDIPVHGLVIHPATGQLDVVVDGYAPA